MSMNLREVLGALKISERQLRNYGALGVTGRPDGRSYPDQIIHEGRAGKHQLAQGCSIPQVVAAREDCLGFLGLGEALDSTLIEALGPYSFAWLVSFLKSKAGVQLGRPASLWLRWNQDLNRFEIHAGQPGTVRIGDRDRKTDRVEILQPGEPWPADSKPPRRRARG